MKKRILSIALACVMTLTLAAPAMADEESDLRAAQARAQEQLGDTRAQLDDLAARQQEVQSQITSMNADLVDLMVQIEQTKNDIALTENAVAEKTAEIEQTTDELHASEAQRDKQYADMKKRIQFIYENGGNAGIALAVLEADDLASFMNKADYATELHQADRSAFRGYVETVVSVSELKATQEQQKADLEENVRVLDLQRAGLEDQEADLNRQIEEKKATDADYANQIEEAKSIANQITTLIAEQQARLDQIEEEKRAAEEARRRAEEARRAAEEAARQAEAEAARRAAEEAAAAAQAAAAMASGSAAAQAAAEAAEAASQAASNASAGRGDIVSYARQFVGNPYVWGGNSLTHGCDCSHFVTLVLTNCGVWNGTYLTSGSWAGAGSPVPGLGAARAGDVIVYSGHVAIYDGNGGLVEAQSSAAGITAGRSATYKPIVAIRRIG